MSDTLNPEVLEVAPGSAKDQLQGWIPGLSTEAEIFEAMDKAFSYRGDVTITRKDGSTIEGFVFDRRPGTNLQNSVVRVIPAGTMQKLSIPYADIAGLAFSGRDTAAGKSWEAWVKSYWQKKAAGEQNIGLAPESLES